MKQTADHWAQAAWLGTGALAAALGVRLLSTAVATVAPAAPATMANEPTRSEPTALPKVGSTADRLEQLMRAVQDPSATGPSPGDAPKEPRTIRPQLLVDVGPARSEVYVGGIRVGHTPYIGEIVCREGDVVKVEVNPPNAVPTAFSGRCEGATLHVSADQAER